MSFYVTLEGIDGIGKSTQVKALAAALTPTQQVITTFEPGASEFGQKIRALLFDVKQAGVVNLHPSASGLLYLSDHIQHQTSKVEPALKDGAFVIQDRNFIDSQRAYYLGGEKDVCYVAHDIVHPDCIEPDLSILLTMDPAVAWQRAKDRGDGKFAAKPWSNPPALTAIQDRYLKIVENEQGSRWVVVEVHPELSQEAVTQVLLEVIMHRFEDDNAIKTATT